MRLSDDIRQDLRSAVIIIVIVVLLFATFLLHLTVTRHIQSRTGGTRVTVTRDRPVDDIAPGRSTSVEDGNATEIPVLCHHFLRQRTSPVEVLRIMGALFLNLPLLGDMGIWTQSASNFDRQMAYLHDNGYTAISMDDLFAWQHGDTTLPVKSVAITFDDGDRSVLDVGYPILKKYGLKATLYLVTGKVGERWEGVDEMTWDEVRFLHESGVFEVESHTHDMHYKIKTPQGYLPVAIALRRGFAIPDGDRWQDDVFDDLTTSRRLIAENLGHNSSHLAWPFGFGDDALDRVAAAAGFRTMATLRAGDTGPIDAGERVQGTDLYGRPTTFLANVSMPRDGNALQRNVINRYTITARTSTRAFKKIFTR